MKNSLREFVLRELKNINREEELTRIGFDSSYISQACQKFDYKLIKIYDLTPAQANILKQTAISSGTDCMTHREVITGKIENSNVILAGSISEIKKIAQKLVFQPFSLKELARELLEKVCDEDEKKETKIIGILNITENSFSDGGMYLNPDSSQKHLIELINDGADGIDIGAESTKPFSNPVDAKTQLERILPILNFIEKENITIPISIDTRSHVVADEVLKRGKYIINDVSGLEYDKKLAEIIGKYGAKVIIQHSLDTPDKMQINPKYNDIMEEIYLSLRNKIDYAHSKGIEEIIIDPGIGFGKTKKDNLEIIERIDELKTLKHPIMVGVSRKSLLGERNNEDKDTYTLAINAGLIDKGIDYIRVHNVKIHREYINILKK